MADIFQEDLTTRKETWTRIIYDMRSMHASDYRQD